MFSQRIEGQYRSGTPLFLSGAPNINLSDKKHFVFCTSKAVGIRGGG